MTNTIANHITSSRPRAAVLLGAIAASLLQTASGGSLITDPSVLLVVDGSQYPIEVRPDSKGYGFSFGIDQPDAPVSMSGYLNPDPEISFSVTVTDFGTPSVFTFTFGQLIVPTGAPNVVSATLVGTLEDVGGDGISLTPSGGPLAMVSLVGPPNTNMGVDLGPAVAYGRTPPPTSPSTYPYGAFSAGPLAGPGPGPWTTMQTTLSFAFSGGGDIARLEGTVTILEVPEVNGGVLFGLAALATGVAWKRRRR